jgi:peptidoglycan hydrolase CwlO-like protein
MEDGLQAFPGSETASKAWKSLTNTVFRTRTPAKITIQINFSTVAENWKLEVSPEDTIADVKQKIFDKYKIPIDDQILHVRGSDLEMNDIQTIKFYVIRENDILHLTLKDKDRPWKIYVEYATGDPVEVGVFPDEPLDQVRIRIFDQDVVLCDENNNEYDYTKSLTENNIKDKQTIHAQKAKARVDVPIRVNEANARHGRSRPATPPVPSRPKTPPPDPEKDRRGKIGDIEIERENESDDENVQLEVLRDTLKGVVPPAAGGAHREPANVPGIVEDDTGRSTVSVRSKKSRAEEAEDLNTALRRQTEKKEKLAGSIEKICRILGFTANKDTYEADITRKIDDLKAKSNKWDTFIKRLDKLLLEDGEIRVDGEAEGDIFTRVQNLKEFSIEIGQILQINGDIDLSAYKQKARDIMDNEARQKASITQLENKVARLKAVLTEKEANISDLQETNSSLKSMEGLSDDLLKIAAQEAESKALTYQQQNREYARIVREKQNEMDQLRTYVHELKSEVLQSKKLLDSKLQKFTEKVAQLVKQNETEKNTLGEQLKSYVADYNEMMRLYDEERKNTTALRHENATHQRQLQDNDRQLKTLLSEKVQLNSTLTQIEGDLAETRRTIHTHKQTIANATNKTRENEQEITKLQGIIRDHEKHAATTATELQRLRGIETQFKASRVGESDQLKTANDQIRQKDDEIRKITVELASTKSELSKLNGDYQKLRSTADDELKLIERLTQEKRDLHKEVDRLNNRTSYVVESTRTLPQATFSRQTRRGGPPGDDDSNYPDTYPYAPHDTDGHGDQASVHFAHLLARLRGLVGERPPIELVEDLVNLLEHYINTPKTQQTLLKRIMPGYTPSRHSMTFHDYLYDYLLQHDSSSSLDHQLRRLREEGHEYGTEV